MSSLDAESGRESSSSGEEGEGERLEMGYWEFEGVDMMGNGL